ncbi:glutathione peroxidase-like protein [Tuber magnatum]|uniref:Glutathione peroxidase n=1 Tax=Tuber magnatum TaxID=42249 RepID=A0A317SWW6_9PEZI|nr:glutathione peroxidase-like protein [Tuber magnatum]
MSSATTFYDLEPLDSKNQHYGFGQLKGKVVLIVNVASKCGFTSQYEGLEKLYENYKDQGLEVLGFPCNQFGGQEPGTAEEIQNFCMVNYGVKFPVLAKIDVNGENASPVYKWLKGEKAGLLGIKLIKWNYEKFLISREGKVVGRYASTTKPESLVSAIEKELNKDTPPSAGL